MIIIAKSKNADSLIATIIAMSKIKNPVTTTGSSGEGKRTRFLTPDLLKKKKKKMIANKKASYIFKNL